MLDARQKKILLIGGVVAASAIILATRLAVGEGFTRKESTGDTGIAETLQAAKNEAMESYERYRALKESDPGIATLKAKVEVAATEDATQTENTIKELGEKLKTAPQTSTTNK